MTNLPIDRFGTAQVVTIGKEAILLDKLPITPSSIGLTKWKWIGTTEPRDMVTVRVTVGADTLAAVIDWNILLSAIKGLTDDD